MILKSTISLAYVALLYLIIPLSKCDQQPNGFTLDLIHTDAPGSPLYDPSISPSQLVVNAFRRSTIRAQSLGAWLSATDGKSSQAQPVITNIQGSYFIKYSIGSAPAMVLSMGIFDTGSDLIWSQCQPCKNCFKQTSRMFDPTKSSTYGKIPCARNADCSSHIPVSSCSSERTKTCQYSMTYGDGTYSDGYLSRETVRFGSVSFPNITFGCGFDNNAQGIVGFGGGKVSLVTQLGEGKFSYCLVPLSSKSNSSKLSFGSNAVVSGRGALSTRLVRDAKRPTFYFVTLKGISVGNQMLRFSRTGGSGKVLIDSGTTMTMLPTYLYDSLLDALGNGIYACPGDRFPGLSCANSTKNIIKNFPHVTVHFDGANVKLKQENLFASASDDLQVLAVIPAHPDTDPIYGSMAQTNFLVGFDLTKTTVSFKPTTCGG